MIPALRSRHGKVSLLPNFLVVRLEFARRLFLHQITDPFFVFAKRGKSCCAWWFQLINSAVAYASCRCASITKSDTSLALRKLEFWVQYVCWDDFSLVDWATGQRWCPVAASQSVSLQNPEDGLQSVAKSFGCVTSCFPTFFLICPGSVLPLVFHTFEWSFLNRVHRF